jgi:hypothetical protein
MLGWMKSADTVGELARLLADPDPAVQAQAAWALGEIDTAPARLALNPAPVALEAAPAPVAALPGVIAAVPANLWTPAVMAALLGLVLLAVFLIWKGPRPASHLGPT